MYLVLDLVLLCRLLIVCICHVLMDLCVFFFFFFKQKTAYEMRISDWSSDVCSSDLVADMLAPSPDRVRIGVREDHLVDAVVLGGQRHRDALVRRHEIGRASCRERVCQYV